MDPKIDLHPDAIAEAHDAYLWYADRSESSANAFMAELDLAIEKICENPTGWATYLHGTRRYLLKRCFLTLSFITRLRLKA